MRILAVETDAILLNQLTDLIRAAFPEAEILAFDNCDPALAILPEAEINIAFMEVEIGPASGIDLARQITAVYPFCDIVFCTEHRDYAREAFELGASDYLLKPITEEKIEHALSLLRHTIVHRDTGKGLYVRCFGEFEVFYNGKPLTSLTKRSKELLAYLIDKAGAVCASSDICNTLFHDSSDSYFRVVKKDLLRALTEIGQEDLLIKLWGKLGINREKIRCDYFDYLNRKPGSQNLYKGTYMQQYSWAQSTFSRPKK
ncbi:MAG: response regulator [Clostridia bacterium]|nr:response regulator [Clostridia bacterium]